MKILLVTTGGTIGSVTKDNVIGVAEKSCALIVNKFKEKYPQDKTVFDVISPVNILSENMSKSVWEKIANTLLSADLSAYDGVIVTHGSDTLAYTASLLGLVLGESVPVAVVAADKPLDDEKSNGVANFTCAVDIIKNGTNGVFVPYRNCDGVTYIHYGVKLRESDVLSDDFFSVDTPFAVYDNGSILVLDKSTSKKLPQIPDGVFTKHTPLKLDTDVLQILQYPSIDFNRYDIHNIPAVMLRLYHAGTACAEGEHDRCVQSLMKRCAQSGADLYLCSAKSGKSDYSSAYLLKSSGARVLYDVSPACAYMKLMLAYNQDKMTPKKFMGL